MVEMSQTFGTLLDRESRNPLLFSISGLSAGINFALKAPGNDSKRDRNIPKVRIWFVTKYNMVHSKKAKYIPIRMRSFKITQQEIERITDADHQIKNCVQRTTNHTSRCMEKSQVVCGLRSV